MAILQQITTQYSSLQTTFHRQRIFSVDASPWRISTDNHIWVTGDSNQPNPADITPCDMHGLSSFPTRPETNCLQWHLSAINSTRRFSKKGRPCVAIISSITLYLNIRCHYCFKGSYNVLQKLLMAHISKRRC